MLFPFHKLFLLTLLLINCKTTPLTTITKLPHDLKEASAIEKLAGSNLLWTIEDAGNKNHIYGFDLHGNLKKSIEISNVKNKDWEDLTSDQHGSLYIGDFGNNKKKRESFFIYKVSDFENDKSSAEKIEFILPKKTKSKDFESFFLLKDHFYIFSKENKKTLVFKVPNSIGKHTAVLIDEFKFDKQLKKITSAAISDDEQTIVLLNHDRVMKISNFKNDDFFKGSLEVLKFKHDTQKEGLCFKNNHTVYITDEREKSEGGKLYEFNIN
ncbi:hypothetical protein F6U93_08295 [Tamlana haliotis]|uniref:Uncharacterized protein n=1 Tax=Pseudotamlana haliotis TaxID=2614804 RepID=A0A6N6MGK6_9FLAO|nr:SdiA-regulated domain-containing protein [Tamlana haliotis]KAB1067931.1 hypothetical protein F6U93_08295 [Tamlana haliotis]